MSFESPWLLLALLLVPLAAVAYMKLERRRVSGAAAWSSPALVPNMVTAQPGWRRYVPLVLFALGMILLLVGFARPEANVSVAREGATVVIAVDISGSMEANDVKPTRLKAVRAATIEFLEGLPKKYRVSLVTFSDHNAVRVAPTYEHEEIIAAFPTKTQQQGTALADGVGKSVTVASQAVGKSKPGQKHPPAAVLVFADGEQNAGSTELATATSRARQLEVPVYTVAVGTPNGVVERKLPGGDYTERIQVPVQLPPLRAIAENTRAAFFEGPSAEQLKRVHEDLGSRLVNDRRSREITVAVTGVALLLILGGAALSGAWFRRLV